MIALWRTRAGAEKPKSNPFRDGELDYLADRSAPGRGKLGLFVDPFTRRYEPNNARAAIRLLSRLGYTIELVSRPRAKPVDQVSSAINWPLIALEPHQFAAVPGQVPATPSTVLGLDEFLVRELDHKKLRLTLGPLRTRRAILLGERASVQSAAGRLLRLIPQLRLVVARNVEEGFKVREQDDEAMVIVASATHYRSHIEIQNAFKPVHIVRVLEASLTRAELLGALKLN